MIDAFEYAARAFEPPPKIEPKWATPYDLARDLDPSTVQTPALQLIDEALTDVEAGRCERLILSCPPQEGKSSRVTIVGPLWFLTRNPDRRIAVVSYNSDLADEFGRSIRNHIADNAGDEGSLDLGLRLAPDNGSIRRFSIAGRRGGVRSVGISGGLTGRPVDALFIDDPISNMEQALSPVWRERAWRFWTAVGRPRLAPHAPVILVLTRWHHSDLAGRLLASEDAASWRVINIPAQARHRPERGETDPLGREPGEWMQSARLYHDRDGKPRQRTPEEWEAIRRTVGPAVWGALYQGDPTADGGDIFPAEWATYEQSMWVDRADGTRWVPGPEVTVAQSWDMAFKDTASSDYVVGQVWARIGTRVFLLDQVRGRMSFTKTLQAVKDLTAKWPQAVAKFVEDKANGTAVINALSLSVPGLIPVEPDGSKVSRAHAVSPLCHSGNVVLPESALHPWAADLKLELDQFPAGANDDQCLVGDTGIETPDGPTRIDQVRPGMLVRGLSGWVRVLDSKRTGVAQVMQAAGLIGTANHPVWTERGWVPLSSVDYTDTVWTHARSAIATGQSRRMGGASSTTSGGGSTETRRSHYALPGLLVRALGAARRSQADQAPACVGHAGSGETTSGSKRSSTGGSLSAGIQIPARRRTGCISSREAQRPVAEWSLFTGKYGKQPRGPYPPDGKFTTSTPTQGTTPRRIWWPFLLANTSPRRWPSGRSAAGPGGTAKRCLRTWRASAGRRLSGTVLRRVAAGTACTRTAAFLGRHQVYNLTTSDGTYFANGVLVHNCDALTQAVNRLLLMPITQGQIVTEDDLLDEEDDYAGISPY